MKSTIKSVTVAVLLIVLVGSAIRSEARAKSAVINIKTSAICGSCKKRIEGALKSTEGIQEAVVNLNNKVVKVKYDPAKISQNQIRLVIVNAGYDADDMKKDEAAFNKLPMCCQKPMAGDHD